jgi:signal recognition particle subunit SEC65
MKFPIRLTAVLAIAAFSFQAQAECAYPKAPASIPDGKTASEPEMIAAMNAFKAYNDQVTSFGTCLDEEVKSAAGGNAMAVKTMKAKKIAAAQEELQSKAKVFNEQVRVFKARG